MYTIYKIINKNNGKIYIGRTNQLKRRMIEHRSQYNRQDRTNNSPLYIAMREEGIENFYHKIIEETDDFEKSCELEKYYIQYYRERLGRDNVYNYQKGGVGGQSHDIYGKNNPMYGKHWTEDKKKQVCRGLTEYNKRRSIPITVINIYTNETRNYESLATMRKDLHCGTDTILKGNLTKNGWKIYKKD